MLLDHVGLPVADYETSKRFYAAALAPLGVRYLLSEGGWAGFGDGERAYFWIQPCKGDGSLPPLHVAFSAPTRALVDAVLEAATTAGARPHRPLAFLREYRSDRHAAFFRDPDGHVIEVVWREQAA